MRLRLNERLPKERDRLLHHSGHRARLPREVAVETTAPLRLLLLLEELSEIRPGLTGYCSTICSLDQCASWSRGTT